MDDTPRAAILVIGDEILKGQSKDTNSCFAARIFYSLGIQVCKIVVIGDELSEIAQQVRELSAQYTFVLTSGGVGPTHDDVTYDGIAAAFQMKLVLDKEIAELVTFFFGSKDKKMAWVPEHHELIYVDTGLKEKPRKWSPSVFPIVKIRNVYVFPGLPQCFEACMLGLQNVFPSALGSKFTDILFVKEDEMEMVDAINATLAKFGAALKIGCYPILTHPRYSTKLTLESSDLSLLNEAREFIKVQIGNDKLVDFTPSDPVEAIMEVVRPLACFRHVDAAFDVSCRVHVVGVKNRTVRGDEISLLLFFTPSVCKP